MGTSVDRSGTLHFNGASNDLMVDGSVLFPCGIASVFSLKFTFRVERRKRAVLLSLNQNHVHGRNLLHLALKWGSLGNSAKLSIKSADHDPHMLDMFNDIRFNTTHTLVMRIDRYSARARVDCGPWRIIGFPGLVSASPEQMRGINVRLGYRRRKEENTGSFFFEVSSNP